MEIVVKAVTTGDEEVEQAVARCVREALGDVMPGDVTVSRLFPGVTAGRRAGLLVVRLPDRLSKAEVERTLARLRAESTVEYAEVPAAKRPMTSS